jgi:hypothetical protein
LNLERFFYISRTKTKQESPQDETETPTKFDVPLFNRLIYDDHKGIAQGLVNQLELNSLRKLVCAHLSEDAFSIVVQRLKTLVLADDFLDWSEISSPVLTALLRFGLPAIATDTAVQCRLADFVLTRF